MSSITSQQTKHDLELVPKEKRFKIRKCNGRLNPRKRQREPTFQVVLDALALTLCYSAFSSLCINLGELLLLPLIEFYLERQLVLASFISPKHKSFWTVSWRNKIGMHTSRDDYLINILRFVSTKEATQIYGAVLPESLTSPEMKGTKAYKTYLASPEEPTGKSKKVKRPTKKSTKAPARGVVIRETPEMPLSRKKEKINLEKRKGIDLLSKVALTEEAYTTKIKPSVTNEVIGVKLVVPDVSEEESSESEAESWGNDEDDSNNDHDLSGEDKENEEDIGNDEEVKDEFIKTMSNYSDDEDETKITDKGKGDEDEEMDYTTRQLYDDVDIRLINPVQADDEMVQKVGTDAKVTNIQQGNKNPEISQVIEDAHVTLSIVP
ncbi:hypothetical protein Tco_1350788 [Tanacetum coccineum]